MLKEENRLKTKAAYNATYNNKNVLTNNLLVMYAGKLKDDKDYPTRVGFVVSKKIHKRAVRRNRIKRLIRESIRLLIRDGNEAISKFQSIIIMPKYDISDKTFPEIQNSILILLNKLANKNI